jgi:nitrogen fixation NifU-like protein
VGLRAQEMDKKFSEIYLEIFKEMGYSGSAIEYIINQVNIGTLKDSDIKHIQIGECGDLVYLYINFNNDGRIVDIKFRYAGCAALAASGSSMTELAKGKTIHEAMQLTEADIMRDLESLPEGHMHCPTLAIGTLRGALLRARERF